MVILSNGSFIQISTLYITHTINRIINNFINIKINTTYAIINISILIYNNCMAQNINVYIQSKYILNNIDGNNISNIIYSKIKFKFIIFLFWIKK